jgi:uncharacterized membrane protein YdbT with pleckstrin-like domain
MSYIERSLGDGEEIIARARFHWLYNVRAWLALLVPMAALIAASLYLEQMARDGAALFAAALLVTGFVVFLSMMIHKWTTEIGVTSARFVKKTGFLSLHTEEVSLRNIESVKVSQGLWGRVFDYGSLRIEGTGDDHVDIPNIEDPVGFRRAIATAKGMDPHLTGNSDSMAESRKKSEKHRS